MSFLLAVARGIDFVNERIGRAISWLTLAMVLLQFAVVIMRYVFGIASLYAQETIIYLYAIVFLTAAGYTLLHDGHVRVDIIYGSASPRRRAWTNLLGTLALLLPFATFIFLIALGYVLRSWTILEGSQEGTGLPLVFLLKTMILVFAVVIFLQGISLLIHSVHALRGRENPPAPHPDEELRI